MNRFIAIVEGDGEVGALPGLVRRIASQMERYDIEVLPPIRVHRDKFLNKPDEFNRMLALAQAKVKTGTVLVLLDADDACPVNLAETIRERAQTLLHGACLAVVVANREFESWFIAAAESLAGQRGLANDLTWPANSEDIRNAKGWLSERCAGGRYREVTDQPALTALFDMALARARSRSFRKFYEECEQAFTRAAR